MISNNLKLWVIGIAMGIDVAAGGKNLRGSVNLRSIDLISSMETLTDRTLS